MNFKHNQRVMCTINEVDIVDAKISINEDGIPFICQNICVGIKADDKLGYLYSWKLYRDFTHPDVFDLRPAEKTWDTLQIGDKIKDDDGKSRWVLGVCGKVIFLSYITDKDLYSCGCTKDALIKRGYTIVQDSPVEEIETLKIGEYTYKKQDIETALKDIKPIKQ